MPKYKEMKNSFVKALIVSLSFVFIAGVRQQLKLLQMSQDLYSCGVATMMMVYLEHTRKSMVPLNTQYLVMLKKDCKN
tara:strand:+ start:320 stop:553 length:234 start_codon:yes stop_codon:yes gene_type:complete